MAGLPTSPRARRTAAAALRRDRAGPRTAGPSLLVLAGGVGHGPHAGHEAVDVPGLHLYHCLHVGDVVLETVAGDGLDNADGPLLGRGQRARVGSSVVAGTVPDLG